MYAAAKKTWAFPPTKAGNSGETPGRSAPSRHLSLGVSNGDKTGDQDQKLDAVMIGSSVK
jgi:hypothetical protein